MITLPALGIKPKDGRSTYAIQRSTIQQLLALLQAYYYFYYSDEAHDFSQLCVLCFPENDYVVVAFCVLPI